MSYNKNLNVANWVSWNLDKNWLGSVSRTDCYASDSTLPDNFYHVTNSDYSGSGYERGHICPSSDRTKTIDDNMATFLLSNMYPQTADLNEGVWESFEYFCRSLCLDSNKELYIISGGIFHNGFQKIKGKLSVPDSCYKIVVVLDYGQRLDNITQNTNVYTVVMPNISGVRYDDWKKYKSNIHRVEQSTGYSFLSNVPFDIRNCLETK